MPISARLIVNKAALKLEREPIRALHRRARGSGGEGGVGMSFSHAHDDRARCRLRAALTALLAYSA